MKLYSITEQFNLQKQWSFKLSKFLLDLLANLESKFWKNAKNRNWVIDLTELCQCWQLNNFRNWYEPGLLKTDQGKTRQIIFAPKHFPAKTFSRQNLFPPKHFPAKTFSRQSIFPPKHFPAKKFSRQNPFFPKYTGINYGTGHTRCLCNGSFPRFALSLHVF